MLVGEIMTSPAVTVREDATPQVAMSLLAQRHLTMLPVVDAASRLVGVVSEVDLLALPEPLDPRAHLRPAAPAAATRTAGTVAELMATHPGTTFRRTAWKCLPVMRDDELVGVISRSDIIRALSRDDDDIEDDVNRLLRDLDPGWDATVSHGVVTIAGPGPEREGDAAASLAATVIGVRAIRLAEPRRGAQTSDRSTSPEWSVDTWVCPPSSGTGVDQL